MKKLLILRSVSKRAREYADRHFKYFTWFSDSQEALDHIKSKDKDERPQFVIVDAGMGADGLLSKAMGLGYTVQTKGVP
jgi:hypothetical protein